MRRSILSSDLSEVLFDGLPGYGAERIEVKCVCYQCHLNIYLDLISIHAGFTAVPYSRPPMFAPDLSPELP
jgi:hypothetical protein